MSETTTACITSPIGLVEVSGTCQGVTSLSFVDDRRQGPDPNAIVREALQQLSEYFEGTRREFSVPIVLQGSTFQNLVWQYLQTIPFGRTASYQDVANEIGRPRAVRAVGAANGRNPIALIVPCHRVVGSDGSLTGYGGGLWRKEWLLRHEGARLL